MEFKLPEIGEGVSEGEIVAWLVEEGESVEEGQALVEVMTDKATVTIDAPGAGTVSKIHVQEGATVAVGSVLADISSQGEAPSSSNSENSSPAPEPASEASQDSGGGTVEFKLPEIGEGVGEGEVVAWMVEVGDTVEEGQGLVEVMTDKATVTIDSPVSGTIQELKADEGATVAVGSVLALIASGSAPKSSASSPSSAPTQASSSPQNSAPAGKLPGPNERVLATPATRKKARELGIDIRSIAGTGKHGRVTLDDVKARASGAPAPAAAAAPAAAPVTAPQAAPQPQAAPASRPAPVAVAPAQAMDERIPIRGIRKKIAEAMTRSKFTATHFTYVEEVDVTELVALRKRLKPLAAERDAKLTYLAFILKATVATLKAFPRFNANMDDANNELIVRGEYNIGIATDTDQGLVVPVLKNADRRSLVDCAKEITRLATGARERKLSVADLQGGTFTITSAGSIGGLFATPILNYPEVAILGVHKIKERPVVKDGEISIGKIMYLSMSLDHRIIDGADAAYFMNHLVRYLEQPDLLMLEG